MIYRENNEYKLAPLKAHYTKNGEAEENIAFDKTEWESRQELGHIADLTFEDLVYTPEQLSRLAEVKDYPETEFPFIEDYVLNGTAAEGSQLFAKKRMEALENAQLELANIVLGGAV